jgi:hypothetical protein
MNLAITAGVIAVTEFIKRLVPQLPAWGTILVAAVLGLLAGIVHLDGTDWLGGILAGLGAVGVHTVASQIGTTNTPTTP